MSLSDAIPGLDYRAAILSDHARIRPLLRAAARAPGDRTAERGGEILSLIEPHARLEEVAFAPLAGDRWVEHVLGEHAAIESGLARAARGDARALRDASLLALGHFAEEEQHVLPRLGGAA